MLMRVSVGIHLNDLPAVLETYDLMSKKFFTHATPTLFNAGTPKPQMSSCFLLAMQDDSIDGIYDTLKQTAKISQSAGGIGLVNSQCSCNWFLHSWYKRNFKRNCSNVTCVQRYGSLRRSRWWKT